MNKIWHPFDVSGVDKKIAIKGHGAYIWDTEGRRYIDIISSWWTNIHGHSHSKIVSAIQAQALQLDHAIFSDFANDSAIELVNEINEYTDNNFAKFFFSDNGSTATEAALKMAYQYFWNKGGKRSKFIVVQGGYHGDTVGAMSLGQSGRFFKIFQDICFEVIKIPFPATWYLDQDMQHKDRTAIHEFKQVIQKNKNDIACIFIEPLIQGASGMRFSSKYFNQEICKIAQENEILTIFDEVMTGFGRTGKMFAYQHLACVPDIICLSKGITGGALPMGMTAVKDFIYNSFQDNNKIFLHGHSYTGNPITSAAALASIKLFAEENTLDKVKNIEKIYANFIKSNTWKDFHKPRFMGGIFALNAHSDVNVDVIKAKCYDSGILYRPVWNTFYSIPPYCISEQDLNFSLNFIYQLLN